MRGPLLEAWFRRYQERAGGHARISWAEFEPVLGRELDQLTKLDGRTEPEACAAALRATANCLARRAVSLADLLAATVTATDAAREVSGGALPHPLAAACEALEHERFHVYSRAYLAQESSRLSTCRRPVPAASPSRPASRDGWGIVGKSAPVRRLFELIAAAATGPQNVLVTGESGTGKELVARAIHTASGSPQRFVAVNCAALPGSLIESELFGHSRGAFTGAAADSPGLFRSAQGGTLFLDEITEMGPQMQAKLLRVLEERTVRAVGSLQEVAVNLRVVASTNRDPQDAIAQGTFRSDLFYRLAPITIDVPPLRSRRSDIPLLVEHFLASFCHRRCGCIGGVSREAMDALAAADWPGNVRELRNAVEHAVTTGRNPLIELDDLPPRLRDSRASGPPPGAAARPEPTSTVSSLATIEAQTIRAALATCGGNKVHAARLLGISRHKLYNRLRTLEGSSLPEHAPRVGRRETSDRER